MADWSWLEAVWTELSPFASVVVAGTFSGRGLREKDSLFLERSFESKSLPQIFPICFVVTGLCWPEGVPDAPGRP